MTNVDLSIIIVSYNTQNILIQCISSVLETVKKNSFEIIVVDNKSTDGTVQALHDLKIKNLKVISNEENYGFSKANNIGVSNSSGKYVLFLNPDTVVYDRSIDGMMEFMHKNVEVGASTCFIELPNGKLDDSAHRGFPSPWNSFTHFSNLSKIFPKIKIFSGYNLTYLNINEEHEIDSCAGAFMLVRREAGEDVNWWDEDFFWYGEDLDFCFRLKEKKWKIYFVPQFKILHYKGVSGGIKNISKNLTTASKETREMAINSRFEAMHIFYKKHYKNVYPGYLNKIILSGINAKWFATKMMSKIPSL